MTSGEESFHAVDQLQELSFISLLKVTLISTSPGATSFVPASGMVFTTTGGMESILGVFCARASCGANWQRAPMRVAASNVFVFIVCFEFQFGLVWKIKRYGIAGQPAWSLKLLNWPELSNQAYV